MNKPPDYPIIHFEDSAAWAGWLSRHHADTPGVWTRLAKKGSGMKSMSQAEALDVALCYGWIDGQARSYDADSWLQKFTPRSRRSVWSKRNREHVARLVAAGLMQPPGLAAVEAAKADGRWDRAYDSPANATVPDDLSAALDQDADAATRFHALTRSQRFTIIYHVQTAVKPETRQRRIAKFVDLLRRGGTP